MLNIVFEVKYPQNSRPKIVGRNAPIIPKSNCTLFQNEMYIFGLYVQLEFHILFAVQKFKSTGQIVLVNMNVA